MDDEKKTASGSAPEEGVPEDDTLNIEPDFDEYDADAAPTETVYHQMSLEETAQEEPAPESGGEDEDYHQISLAEETPELFGDSASETAQALEKTARESAQVPEPSEAQRQLDELLEKQSRQKEAMKNAEWEKTHQAFTAEAEQFASEAETFAKRVSAYVKETEKNFTRYELEERRAIEGPMKPVQPSEASETAAEETSEQEKQPEAPAASAASVAPARRPRYWHRTPVEPALQGKVTGGTFAIPLAESAEAFEAIPEELPQEENAAVMDITDDAAEVESPAENAEEAAPKPKRTGERSPIWHRTPVEPKLLSAVTAGTFDIPVGTPEELAEAEKEDAVFAKRERPKSSFNDEKTHELNPLEELQLETDNDSLEAYLGVKLPDKDEYPEEEDTLRTGSGRLDKIEEIDGDTTFLPDADALKAAAAWKEKIEEEERQESEDKAARAAALAEAAKEEEQQEKSAAAAISAPEQTEPAPPEEEPDSLDRRLDELADPSAPKPKPPKKKRGWKEHLSELGNDVMNALEGGESEGEFEGDDLTAAPQEEDVAVADKTVGIPPMYNQQIDHQIRSEKREEDDSPDSIPEERSSFKTAVLKPLPEDEDLHKSPTVGLDEIAGLVRKPKEKKKHSKFRGSTAELEEVPNIIDADAQFSGLDKTILANGSSKPIAHENTEELDGQIHLPGFDDEAQQPEQIDEKHVEAELQKKRRERAKNFRLNKGAEEDGEKTKPSSVEDVPVFAKGSDVSTYLNSNYDPKKDPHRLSHDLERNTRSGLIASVAEAILTVLSLVFGIFVALASGTLDAVGGSSLACGGIALLILVLSGGFGWQLLRKGFRGIVHGKINAASGILAVFAACLIEDITMMLADSAEPASLYTAAACFAMCLGCFARHISLKRARDNFKFLSSGTRLYSTRVVESGEDAGKISGGVMAEEKPAIAYTVPADIPQNFVEDSFADDPADANSRLPFLVILGVAFLAAIVFGAVNGSAVVGVNAFAAFCAAGFPSFGILAYHLGLYNQDASLSRSNAAILGHRAIEKSAFVDTYAMDSRDLFGKGSCSIVGIKTYHHMLIDDAILYAAALVIPSEGPLSSVFEKTILGKKELLPETEDLMYEERLGLSAWIGDRRVLFGNREFLRNHNVKVPTEEEEAEYTAHGRKVCYLAISGKIAAMFVLRYRVSRRVRRCMKQMDRAGITMLIRNTDCNVTEEMISQRYRIPIGAIKIIHPVSGDLLQEYRKGAPEKNAQSSDIGIFHTGSPQAAMHSLYEARRLYEGNAINSTLSIAYSAVAVIIGIVLSAVSGVGLFNDPKVLLIQVIGALVALGIAGLRSRPKDGGAKRRAETPAARRQQENAEREEPETPAAQPRPTRPERSRPRSTPEERKARREARAAKKSKT